MIFTSFKKKLYNTAKLNIGIALVCLVVQITVFEKQGMLFTMGYILANILWLFRFAESKKSDHNIIY